MIAICAWCKKHLGEKEPLETKTETHGICDECFAEMAERVQHNQTPYVAEEVETYFTSSTSAATD